MDVQSWDERKLNEVSKDEVLPSFVLDIRWPVGPTAPLIKPKWNVVGRIDPICFCLSRDDFSLFRFFVSYNLLEPSRFLSKRGTNTVEEAAKENLVLFGYEKIGVPPTTYSIKLSFEKLEFQFVLDEGRRIEGMMNVDCANVSWSLVKLQDCIFKQNANCDSICLRQTSNRKEWAGFPDLLLPLPSRTDPSLPCQHCLLQFTSTTHPNGNNVKTLNLDSAGIYLIVPAWQHVANFFTHLKSSPEVFKAEEMTSIMQVGDRFYRMTKRSQAGENEGTTAETNHTIASPSKQFLLTLKTPRIIQVADATDQQVDTPCVTLCMAHLNLLCESNDQNEVHSERNSVFCDGLEIFTGMARTNPSNGSSSLLCPLSISGSMRKSVRGKSSPQDISGWIWMEELQARAAYTDLTHAIDVFNGVRMQLQTGKTDKSNKSAALPPQEAKEPAPESKM